MTAAMSTDNDPGVLARELREIREWLRTLHRLHPTPTHLELNLAKFTVRRAANYLESLSAPVEDEEKVAKAITPAIQAALSQVGIDRSQMTDADRLHVSKVAVEAIEYARRLRAAVGVTVGEPALTGLEAEAWQPIETAPKTSCVLVGGGRFWWDGDSCPTEGEILSSAVRASWDGENWSWDGFWALPTHWQPLPAPPALQANGVSGSPSSPKQTSELEEAEAIGCGGLK